MDVLVEQGDCTPACAVAIHSFTNDCMVSRHDITAIWVAFFSRWQRYRCRQDTLNIIMGGDARQMSIVGFEQMCLVSTAAAVATFSLGLLMTDGRCGAQNTADPLFFLHAIMGADCSMALGTGGQPYICVDQINLGEPTARGRCLSLGCVAHTGWGCVADQLPGATATAGPYMDDRGTPEVFIDMIHTPEEWTTSPSKIVILSRFALSASR